MPRSSTPAEIVESTLELASEEGTQCLVRLVQRQRSMSSHEAADGPSAALKALVGAGDRIAVHALPVAVVGLAANILWPSAMRMGLGSVGLVIGGLLLTVGVPLWLTSAVQILTCAPRGKLITTGPFALMLHPLYTSVALLVIPGCGLLFDSWLGCVIGLALYGSSRVFAPSEERDLATRFSDDDAAYRKQVLLPWL